MKHLKLLGEYVLVIPILALSFPIFVIVWIIREIYKSEKDNE